MDGPGGLGAHRPRRAWGAAVRARTARGHPQGDSGLRAALRAPTQDRRDPDPTARQGRARQARRPLQAAAQDTGPALVTAVAAAPGAARSRGRPAAGPRPLPGGPALTKRPARVELGPAAAADAPRGTLTGGRAGTRGPGGHRAASAAAAAPQRGGRAGGAAGRAAEPRRRAPGLPRALAGKRGPRPGGQQRR